MERIFFNTFQIGEVKIKLLEIIVKVIDGNCWNQTKAASVLGIDQPKISQIRNGKIAGFSMERLLTFLAKLKCKVDITIDLKQIKTESSLESKVKLEAEEV
ncbi:helix-turn-helix domain-containing protein [Wolbachia endosymbiont of Pentidionis agamae]|uniref:helix-turn-helix domain-containing protein n=1 Tax=Wolbachia endosymbiont of Pentidionis agamae TaxID=3110435 RepID=UPI002FD754AB